MHRWLIPCVYLWMYMCLCACDCEGLHVWANINASGGVCLNRRVGRSMSTCMRKLPVRLCVQAQLYSPVCQNACIHVCTGGRWRVCQLCGRMTECYWRGCFSTIIFHCQCGSYFQKWLLPICRAVNWCQSCVFWVWHWSGKVKFPKSPDPRKLSWVCKVIENRYF